MRDARRQRARPGRAVQVDPINLMLKPPGTKHLKLNCDILLPTFAFKLKLRHFSLASTTHVTVVAYSMGCQAGAYTRPLSSST